MVMKPRVLTHWKKCIWIFNYNSAEKCWIHWIEEILRKLPRMISQECANVTTHKFITAKQSWKCWVEHNKVVNEEISQEEQQADTLQPCSSMVESLNDESSNGEYDDGTCKICKRNVEIRVNTKYTMNISDYDKNDTPADDFFCSICIGS